MSDCLFCQIIDKHMPADIIQENDQFIIFKDIRPKAAVHLLVVPKVHINNLNEMTSAHQTLIYSMLANMKKLAKTQGLKGYRVIVNTGREGGQEIDHLHFHVLGGHNLPGF